MANWTLEQLEAINKEGTNIIVSAGAGSGKTAVLSERVLRKIKEGVSINQLLILTFTNAAASEMKERIRKKLIEFNLLEEANKIDSAYITTFDSYALSIVKKYHYLFNISRDIKIIDNSIINLKKEQIIEEIFEQKYLDKDKQFLKLIDDFCTKDDLEIKDSIIKISNKLDLRYDKEKYLKNYINTYYNNLDDLILKYLNLILKKIEMIKYHSTLLLSLVDGDYGKKFSQILAPLLSSKQYENIKKNVDIKLPSLPRGSSQEIKEEKEEINNIIKELKKLTKYNSKEQIYKELILTKDYASIICKIILELDEKLKQFKFEKNQFEFIDISKMAIAVVNNNSYIREEIKNSYNEILLDEYQDTNDLQELFINLIENNNVYMVGDIKQSIYRFRNANPYIFKEKYDKYSNNINGHKIDLNKNFRSRKEVLNNINLIFNCIMDDDIGSANYYEEHQMIFGNKSYDELGKTENNNDFEIFTYDYKDSKYSKAEIEIFTVAQDIKNKVENNYKIYDKDEGIKRNITYKDFVILIDRSTNFDLYKKIFEYLNIPLNVYKDENIADKTDLNLIKNILNLIIKQKEDLFDEEYKYNFISIARSYLFRISDQDIFKCIKEESYENNKIILKVNKVIESLDILPLNKIIKLIVDEFDFYQKLSTVGNIEKSILGLDYILELSRNLESFGYDIYDFIDYLNNIADKKYNISYSPNSENSNSVKIMTIHKSKGLEYHVCYYTGLYSKFNISDIKERFSYDNKYGLILPIYKEGIDTTIVLPLLKEKYLQEEISEKIRLFYVALTRAKEKMILLLPQTSNKSYLENKIVNKNDRLKYKSFADILNSINNIIEPYVNNIDLEQINLTKDYNLIKKINYKENISDTDKKFNVSEVVVNNISIENKHFSKESNNLYTKKEFENINYGKELHEKLEYDNKSEQDLINKYFNDEKPIKIYHEFEFMYEDNNLRYHGIIDMMVEYDKEIKIIDYKLKNIDDEKYHDQLKGYKNYISKVSNKKIRIYLYSIIEKQLEEIK